MGILDKELQMSEEQAVTATAASTNLIDTGHTKDIGDGEPLYWHVDVTEAATAAGAATVTFTLESDTAAAFSSAATVMTSNVIGKASLTVGAKAVCMPIPPGVSEQFLRTYYTVATGPLTAGKFNSYIGHAPQTNDRPITIL